MSRFRCMVCILLVISVLSACVPPAPAPTSTPTPAPSATSQPSPAPTATPIPSPTPTPDPRNTPIQVSLDPSLNLEGLSPQQAVTVLFDRPMDPKTAAAPLITYPYLAGKTAWNETNTALTFEPESRFEPGQDYFMLLDRNIKDVYGRIFEKVQQWKVHISNAPSIINRETLRKDKGDMYPVFTLTFDRLMDHASVERALSVRPSIPLKLTWTNKIDTSRSNGIPVPKPTLPGGDKDNPIQSPVPDSVFFNDILSIRVTEPVSPGETYLFTIANLAADENGISLAKTEQWIEHPEAFSAEIGTNLVNELFLTFNYPLDMQKVIPLLSIDPPISGKWEPNYDYYLSFTASQGFEYGVAYTLKCSSTLPGKEGLAFPAFNPIPFNLPAPIDDKQPFLDYSVDPSEIDFRTPVVIDFRISMDRDSTEAALKFTPEMAGTFEWKNKEKTLVFTPAEKWGSKNYVGVINVGAKNATGHSVLLEPYTFQFHDESYLYYYDSKSLVFSWYGPGFQAVDANGHRAIQFGNKTQKAIRAEFSLAPLTRSEFAQRFLSFDRNYRSANISGFDNLTIKKTWNVDITALPFNEMTIPADIPPGLYVLSVTDGKSTDHLFLALTSHTLLIKTDVNHINTWSTDFLGNPQPGVEMRLFNNSGSNLIDGKADEAGFWSTALSPQTNIGLIMASLGKPEGISASGDVAVTAVDSSFRNYSDRFADGYSYYYDSYYYGHSRPSATVARSFIYTDRPIYQPGQKVSYKIILREEDDARYNLPPVNTPVKVTILDARANIVNEFTLFTNSFGTVNGAFNLADEGMLGSYKLQVEALGQTSKQKFEVQEFQKPEYVLSIHLSSSAFVSGDNIEIDGYAKYFNGEPLTNSTISFNTYRKDYYWGYYYSGEGDSGLWLKNERFLSSVKTDEHGHFHAEMKAPELNSGYYYDPSPVTWLLEAQTSDESKLVVSQSSQFEVFPSAERITLSSDRFIFLSGQSLTASVVVTDLFGKPISDRLLDVSLYEISDYSRDVVYKTISIKTDEDGKAKISFEVDHEGYYRIQAEGLDKSRNRYEDSTWLYVTNNSSFPINNKGTLSISTDRSEYKPYEMAKIRIESDFSGPALLTFERGSVLKSIPIQLTQPITEISQVLGDYCAPNVFIKVNAWRLNNTLALYDELGKKDLYAIATIADSNLLTRTAEIKVESSLRKLNISITPDLPAYYPRQEASFNIQVTSADGTPARAELSLALVDESIFGLKSDPSGQLIDTFYGERSLSVDTYDQMTPFRVLVDTSARGGGGGFPSPGNPRSLFADTALWLPVVITDQQGKAVIRVTLPDNLTSWRLTVRAVTADTRVGDATLNIITTQPIIVRPMLPNSLTEGDHAELGALVSNTTDQPQSLKLNLEVAPTGYLTIDGDASAQLDLKPGEAQIVAWMVKADSVSDLQVTISAQGQQPEMGDSIRLPLKVNPFSVQYTDTSSGALGGASEKAEYTATFVKAETVVGSSGLTITLARSLNGSLIKGLDDLTGYPYGCVEQTMSKALPNAVVSRAFNLLGEKKLLNGDLNLKIHDGLQKLYNMQHNDGGWGWWHDDQTNVYMTAWVLFGLTLTREAGYPVSATVIDNAVSYLIEIIGRQDPEVDDLTMIYTLYSLAVAGKGNLDQTVSMIKKVDTLDPFSLAALAQALFRLKRVDEANIILNGLEKMAIQDSGKVYWPTYIEDGEYSRKTMSSTVRTTAMVMDTWIQIRPDSPLIAGMENYLMANRGSFGWGTTNETAFAILALTDRLVQVKKDPKPEAYSIALNGRSIAEGQLEPGKDSQKIEIPALQMENGINLFHLSTTAGGSTLYYTVTSAMFIPEPTFKSTGVILLERSYYPQNHKDISNLQPGDLVEVLLKYKVSTNEPYLLIEDHLPGGLVAINEELNTSGYDQNTIYESEEDIYHYQSYGYNRKEIHGDTVLFFITENGPGTHTITYLARVGRPGNYLAVPAQISSMYDPTYWGRSASSTLEVKPSGAVVYPPVNPNINPELNPDIAPEATPNSKSTSPTSISR